MRDKHMLAGTSKKHQGAKADLVGRDPPASARGRQRRNRGVICSSWRRLQPLATDKMPLDLPPPRDSRFGSPLVLSRVHWVRPELVVEVKFLTWTQEGLLRQVIYQGL